LLSFLTIGFECQSRYFSTFAQSVQTTKNGGRGCRPAVRHHACLRCSHGTLTVLSRGLIATFGGTTSKQGVFTVNSDSQQAPLSQLVMTPVGTVSVFRIQRRRFRIHSGWSAPANLVTDMDEAIRAAKATGADILVTTFDDPIGRDAIIQWPGGVNTQLYWHTTAPSYAPLETVPENRVYVSRGKWGCISCAALSRSLHGSVVSMMKPRAPGVENRKIHGNLSASKGRVEVREVDRARYRRSPTVSVRPGNDWL